MVTLLRVSAIALLVYAGLMGLTYLGFQAVPVGFIPEQDKGYLVVNAQLPDGASLERSDEIIRQHESDRAQHGRRRPHHRLARVFDHPVHEHQQCRRHVHHPGALRRAA